MKHLLMSVLIIAFLLNPHSQLLVQAIPDFTCAEVTEIPQIECDALVALYNSTDGPSWVDNTGWLETNTPDSWTGVVVDSGHVTRVILGQNNLVGTIPPELGNLSYLVDLYLWGNQLGGSIPPQLGDLSNLGWLYLDNNQLSGPIPAEFGNLGNLVNLILYNNQLTGSIPAELGSLTLLEIIRLQQNALTGDVPDSLINLVNLYDAGAAWDDGDGLDLDYNMLNVPEGYPDPDNPLHVFLDQKDPDWYLTQGPFSCEKVSVIPLSECEALVALYNSTDGPGWLYNTNWLVTNTPSNWYGLTVEDGHVTRLILLANWLTGSLPPELVDLSYLRELDVHSNQISGPIPPELGNFNHLIWLNLRENQFNGSIPPQLSNLTSLWDLDLRHNRLSGLIPIEFGNLSSLLRLYLSNNQLSGSIPAELGNLSHLGSLYLDNNLLSGSIPTELGKLTNLETLFIGNNQLSGSIPIQLSNLGTLYQLSMPSNLLSGEIPALLGSLSSLGLLDLSHNQLSGSIPPELGSLSSLWLLDLSQNQLTNSIPPELGDLNNLWGLWLYSNELSGSIPPEIGHLPNLEILRLEDNQLSGVLPYQLGNLGSLRVLELSNNLLIGSIPPELALMTNLEYLILSENQLSGAIPPELGNMSNLWILRLNDNRLTGDIPDTFINLVSLFDPGTAAWDGGDGLDLDYNALNVPEGYPNLTNPLQVFLSQKDPDWHTLQAFEQVISSEGGVITSLDSRVEFVIEAGMLVTDTTFTYTPQPDADYATGLLSFAGSSFQLTAEDDDGSVETFDPPIIATLYYSDADLLSIPEDSLALYYWDGAANDWVDIVTTCQDGEYTRDMEGNVLSVPICHLSEFAMLGEPYRSLLPLVQVSR